MNRLFSDSNSEHDDGLVNSHDANRTLSETHDGRILQKAERRPLVKWPEMTNTSDWTDFDEDAASNVKMLMHGTVKQKLSIYEKIVHAIAVQHFGVSDVHTHREPNLSRRKRRLRDLRKQQRDIRKRLREAPDDEKEGLTVLGDQIHNEVLLLRRKERASKRRTERKRTRSKFMRDPFKTATNLLQPVSKSQLNCSKEDLDRHLQQTYSVYI